MPKTLLQNKVSENSQKFFFSRNSTPVPTVHNGDVYQIKENKIPFNRYYFGKHVSSKKKD